MEGITSMDGTPSNDPFAAMKDFKPEGIKDNKYDVIEEKTIADAILDRLVHDANRVDIDGDSMRKNKKLRNL